MPTTPSASVVIPTRSRAGYLEVTLRSVVAQAHDLGAEVLVVSDGVNPAASAVAVRHRVKILTLPVPKGSNAARNAGVAAAAGPMIVLIDDDVLAPQGWLAALLAGASQTPDADVFGGPIRARLEGGGPRACGRESAPISTLDLGPDDTDAEFVWSANMAIRARTLKGVGPFDERIAGRGEEEDWLRRYSAGGGRIRYLAGAGLEHRREAPDCTIRALSRAEYRLGRTARRYDATKGAAAPLWRECRMLAGCVWHTVRRRCGYGVVMAAHSAGRVRELLTPVALGATGGDDFVSGTSGQVWGPRASTRTAMADALLDGLELAQLLPWRLRRAAAAGPRRRVLVLGIVRTDAPNLMADAQAELVRSRHDVEIATTPVDGRGKFENLNALLEKHPVDGFDWLLALDDDVSLPHGFLDSFVFLAERFDLLIAQPAHRRRSHAAWQVTRRRPFSVVRETRFVEVGPVTAFRSETLDTLLPFPSLRFGWGLDLAWSAVAGEHDWPIGIVDATPVRHGLRRIAAAYDRGEAIAEARAFLAQRPYTTAAQAKRTVLTHRSW